MEEFDISLQAAVTPITQKAAIFQTTTMEVELSPPVDNSSPQLIPDSSSPPRPSMAQLLDLAPEVLHHIFKNVEPTDLASLSSTCHHLDNFIKKDELLWKLNYLSRFDPPSDNDSESWRARLTRLIKLQKILESDNEEIKASELATQNLEEILSQTVKLAYQSISTSTKTTYFLGTLYKKAININEVLCKSSLFSRARPRQWPAAPFEHLRQLSAELHVLAGMNIDSPWPASDATSWPHTRTMFDETYDGDDYSDPEIDESSETDDARLRFRERPTPIRDVHPWARSRVYDLRRYRQSNMWGPFMDDGSQRTDWEKVQAIMIVLAYNHRMYSERRGLIGSDFLGLPTSTPRSTSEDSRNVSSTRTHLLKPWEDAFSGIAPNSYVSSPLTGKIMPPLHPELNAFDPYGVTGTWMRIVCFLDYNDLYRFNFERSAGVPANQEREPITTREAFRLIKLQLHVTRIEEQEGVDQDGRPLLPVVFFEGTSRSTFMAWDPNANSRIRGTVHQTPGGAIRWTSFSIFHGEERWRSEGVQIGGLKSARGILGNWFDKDFNVHGPAGPTAFWKISDEMVEEKRSNVPNVMQIFMAE